MEGSKPLKKRPIRLISRSTIETKNDKEISVSMVMVPTKVVDKLEKLAVVAQHEYKDLSSEERPSLKVPYAMPPCKVSTKLPQLVASTSGKYPSSSGSDENENVDPQGDDWLRNSSTRTYGVTTTMTVAKTGTKRRIFGDATNSFVTATVDLTREESISAPTCDQTEESFKPHEDKPIQQLRMQGKLGWEAIAKCLNSKRTPLDEDEVIQLVTPRQVQERFAVVQKASSSAQDDENVFEHYQTVRIHIYNHLGRRLSWCDL